MARMESVLDTLQLFISHEEVMRSFQGLPVETKTNTSFTACKCLQYQHDGEIFLETLEREVWNSRDSKQFQASRNATHLKVEGFPWRKR